MSEYYIPIDVLDHGFVRLVDHMGSDLSVVRAARTSYAAEWRVGEDEGSDKKLINYLWKNKHTSPFESVVFTFEVKAPIFVARQWFRHRTQSFSECSARYSQLREEFYLPDLNKIGIQSSTNKQSRDLNIESKEDLASQVLLLKEACENSFKTYRALLEKDWPREIARCILPVNTYTHFFTTMNMLNLFKFLSLRAHSHAQYEIQVYAEAIIKFIEPIVPVCTQAWKNSEGRND